MSDSSLPVSGIRLLPGAPAWCRRAHAAMTVVVLAIAGSNLLAWLFGFADLRMLTLMRFNTALALTLSAIGLWLRRETEATPVAQQVATGLGIAVALIGGLTAWQYFTGWNLGFDEWFFEQHGDTAGSFTSHPGRMSLNAALSLFAAGLALAMFDVQVGRRVAGGFHPAAGLALLASLPILSAFVGYALGIGGLTGVRHSTNLLLHTAIAQSALCLGILLARPMRAPIRLLLAAGPEGLLLRRVAPPMTALFLALGWLVKRGETAGYYAARHTLALLLLAGLILLACLLYGAAVALANAEARRSTALEARRESDERLQLAVHAAQLGTWDIDLRTGIAEWSHTHFDALGPLPRGSATTETWRSRVHPDDLPAVEAEFARARRERSPYRSEHRVLRADTGAVVWLNVAGNFLGPAGGEPERFVGVFADVTERKAAEQRLRESEERSQRHAAELQAVYDTAPVGLCMLDRELRWVRVNERLAALNGFPVAAHLGRRVRELLPGVADAVEAAGARIFATGESMRDLEIREPHPNGGTEERIWLASYYPRRDDAGEIVGLHVVTEDVTERRRTEEALREQAAALREADRRKDEFLAMLAHELRNPLASVSSATTLLKEAEDAESRAWAIDVVERQSRQLTRLIDDLLDVSRITRGKVQLRPEILDAACALDNACDAIAPLVRERRHTLHCDYPRGSLWIDADPARLEQIVVNLLANAARYTDAGGQLWLEADRAGAELVIRVRDQGIGMAPEKIAGMFDLFAQGERSVARSEGGLGIGLTVVRALCELHGGSVAAQSAGPGTGCTFTVRLPAAAPPAVPEAAGGNPGAGVAARVADRILVVDDNLTNADVISRLLRRRSYEVEVAHDGPAALDLARVFRPAAVLLDIGLPGMDGYEVARQLRTEPCCADAVIIALSGYGQDDDRRLSREAGFDHHLVKPVNFEELHALLAGMLEQKPAR